MQRIFFCICLCFLLKTTSLFAQTLPAGFSATAIGSGWNNPVGAVFSPDGQRLFVWEKAGKIFVCNRNAGNYVKQTTAVLNISPEVGDWRDHGLLGFALDPNFASNGYIYLLYVVDRHHLLYYGQGAAYSATTNTYSQATIGRITRYQTSMNGSNLTVDTLTRQVLLGETISTGMPILYESHGVGSLAFAADGTLLATCGDGASYSTTDPGSIGHTYYIQAMADGIIRSEENVGSFRSQLLNSLSGKLIRIDPATGNGISSNPFYDPAQPRAAKSRVWAMGFRNPFRMTVRPGTGSTNPATGDIGEIYIGDVGWNIWEELNIVKAAGQNCGWPLYEGQTSLTSYYNLSTANPEEPNPLNGTGSPTCTQPFFTFKNLLKQASPDESTTIFNPCNLSQEIGTNNRYYHRRPALDWRHGTNSSRVGTFDLSNNTATVAEIGTPASGVTGTPFQGNCSIGGTWYTGNAFPTGYKNTFFQADLGGQWLKRITIDFTDVVTRVDNFGTGFNNLVCITQNPLDGSLVTVEIGGTGVKKISYGGNQSPIAKISADNIFGPGPLTVNFSSAGSSDADGSISSYAWNFGDGNTSTAAAPSKVFTAPVGTPTKFIVRLTVTDNLGATGIDSLVISVNNTPPVVNITSPVKNSLYAVGSDTIYSCQAAVSDAEHVDGKLKYAWQTFLCHNNHRHPESIDTARVTNTTISRIGCNGDDYYWLVELTVTDEAGLSTKDSTKIFPDCSTTLNGSVTLQGRPTAPNVLWQVPLTVDFYEPGNMSTPIFTRSVTTNQSGSFSISGLPIGTYSISVKSANTLRRVMQDQVLPLGASTIHFGTLMGGDVNNNNQVTLSDASILFNTFNKAVGSPGYDARADLNGDGVITLSDASVLLANFNKAGE